MNRLRAWLLKRHTKRLIMEDELARADAQQRMNWVVRDLPEPTPGALDRLLRALREEEDKP